MKGSISAKAGGNVSTMWTSSFNVSMKCRQSKRSLKPLHCVHIVVSSGNNFTETANMAFQIMRLYNFNSKSKVLEGDRHIAKGNQQTFHNLIIQSSIRSTEQNWPLISPVGGVIEWRKDKSCLHDLRNSDHIANLHSKLFIHKIIAKFMATAFFNNKLKTHNSQTPNLIWFKPPLAFIRRYPLVFKSSPAKDQATNENKSQNSQNQKRNANARDTMSSKLRTFFMNRLVNALGEILTVGPGPDT